MNKLEGERENNIKIKKKEKPEIAKHALCLSLHLLLTQLSSRSFRNSSKYFNITYDTEIGRTCIMAENSGNRHVRKGGAYIDKVALDEE